MFVTICNTHCVINCKIQMICSINSQKLITVYVIMGELQDFYHIFDRIPFIHLKIFNSMFIEQGLEFHRSV